MTASNDRVQIQHHTPTGRPVLSDRGPEGLRRMLEGGRCLVLVGRNSSSSGRAGAEAAARDLYDAARELRDAFGFDVTACLPSIRELTDALMATRAHKSADADGNSFTNRFTVFVLAEHRLVLSLSAGSAMKLDKHGRQPHAEHLRILLSDRDLDLGGFYAKRPDRVTRDMWSAKAVLRPLENLKKNGHAVWAGVERTQYALDGSDDVQVFIAGYGSSSEATAISRKRLTGAERWTATHPDENGWVSWGVGRTIPPGMMRLEVKNGRSAITFDTPQCYPDQGLVSSVLPDVRHDDGGLVDQVANVRWFWENLADVGLKQAMRTLCERKYSTQTLRDRSGRGPGSYFGSAEDPFDDPDRGWDAATSWARSLFNNLEFYKSGELAVSLKPDHPKILITGIIPPDGPWMTLTVADEVNAYLQRPGKTRTRKPSKWSWSGFPVLVNGTRAELRPPHTVDDPDVRWRVSPLDAASEVRQYPAVPDRHLMEAITRGLLAADGHPLRAAISEGEAPEIRGMLRDRDRLVSEVRSRERSLTTRQQEISATDPETGAFLMPPAFRAAEMEAWASDHAAVEGLRIELGATQRRIENARDGDGVEVHVLERILDELRDPRATTMRSALRDAVVGLEMNCRPTRRATFKGHDVDLKGDLVISHKGEPYTVPFSTTFQSGSVTQAIDAVAALATSMRHGTVPTHTGSRVPGSLTLLARAIGIAGRRFTLGRCQDPDLLRLGMAALYPNPVSGEDPESVPTLKTLMADPTLNSTFGDVARLVENLRASLSRGEARWLIKDGAPFETWAILAGAGKVLPLDFGVTEVRGTWNLRQQARRADRGQRYARWTFPSGERPVITPCQFCGSRLCAPMRIREVEGFLCLGCRRDEGGVMWPARFNQYLSSQRLWEEAGVVSEQHRAPAPARPADRREQRTMSDLSNLEIDQIVQAYLDEGVPVSEIIREHLIGISTLYAIRASRCLPYRYRGLNRREGTLDSETRDT